MNRHFHDAITKVQEESMVKSLVEQIDKIDEVPDTEEESTTTTMETQEMMAIPEVPEVNGNEQEEQAAPMSKLKLQRQKEKERKEKRKMEKKVDSGRQRVAQRQAPTKKFDHKQAKWSEAKERAMAVWNNINAFAEIGIQASLIVNRPDIIIDDNTKNFVNQRVNVYTGDIQNLKNKWQELSDSIQGKDGKVLLDDFPFFYTVYMDYLSLQQDVNNVLTEQAAQLSGVVQAILDAVKKAQETENGEAEVAVDEEPDTVVEEVVEPTDNVGTDQNA